MEAGLLAPAEWRACWIHPHEAEVPAPGRRPAYLLRDEVVLASHVVRRAPM